MRIMIALLLVVSVEAHAGSIALNFGTPLTLTTTAAQDTALARVLADVNAEKARQIPPLPPFTLEEFLGYVLNTAVQTYVQQARTRNAADACATYQALVPADQAIVLGKLGGKSPCP